MAAAHGRRPARRRARLLDLAHAQSPRRRRQAHPDPARRGSRADRDRPRDARGRHRLDADRLGLRGPGRRDRPVPAAGEGVQPPRHHQPAAVRCPPRRLARADDADRRGQRRGAADHRPGALASDQRAARARAVAEPVHGPAELQAHRPSAVPGTAGPAASARLPRPPPGRGVRGQPARQAGRALGPHVPAGRSAGLRTDGREQHRRPGGARRPLARGGRLRPAARRRRQGHPLSAGHQLCRRQPRRGAGDDLRAQLADRPGRRRRPCRHHVRRHRHQLHADALDARSRPRARCSRCRGRSSAWPRTTPRRSA